MRVIALTAIATFAAAPSFASSIEVINGTRLGNGSIIRMSCPDCPAPKPPETYSGYKVPVLESGVQKEEIRDFHGERVIMRTDRWMGGSPAVFYQRLTPEMEAAMTGKPLIGTDTPPVAAAPPPADGIDSTATTAAVAPQAPAAPPNDFPDFELRLR
ncbi:hypothetical protein NOF55_16035 [Rhizobiaceae bacterium BDR2-2]|uniref:Lipoprotein n=1 Tax=Ectorhizobium quercum TaxID=2965071 RepID=A0AAE3SU65_9HYPH|nr:plant virulence effector HPE1-like domain-containing protein [Ectorhizobium quercum]MCX8996338.1 hypothetical protein [Ectorhizobium quercum]MCX8998623.1 hypothetical protein [Ectorhizobium quercum]